MASKMRAKPGRARYGPEIDNLRVAISWALGPDGDARLVQHADLDAVAVLL